MINRDRGFALFVIINIFCRDDLLEDPESCVSELST